MASIVFDSHALIMRLRFAGLTEEQAEAVADAGREVLTQRVTKEDLDERLKSLERRSTIELGAIVAAGVGIILAAMRIL